VQLKTFETGVQRLYYVAWLLFSGTGVLVNIDKLSLEYGHIGDKDLIEFGASILAVCIGPWIAMRLFRWVYRGFNPLN
jgi:hypothetical protein